MATNKFRALNITHEPNDAKDTDNDLTLDVAYYTSSDGNNLNQINATVDLYPSSSLSQNGKPLKRLECKIIGDELYHLPLAIKGIEASLVDRAKYKIKTRNRGDNVDVFITGLTSVVVQFKLWGQLFKDSPCPIDSIKPEMFSAAVFAEIEKQAKRSQMMNKWTEPMLNFWNKWGFMFEQECSCADRVSKLETDVHILKQQTTQLLEIIGRLEMMLNSTRMVPTYRC